MKEANDLIVSESFFKYEDENQVFKPIYYDIVTGLSTELGLEKALRMEIKKHPDKKKALLYIEVDDYDSINNIKGYSFGNKLMVKITKRISDLLLNNHKLCRGPGGSFILFVKEYKDETEIVELAVLICQSFKKAFEIEGFKINLSIKIGLVLYPKHRKRPGDLLNHARVAIYKGKQIGRNRIWLCNCDEYSDYVNTFTITQDLYVAMEKKELELFYQPQLDLQTQKITGFEALSRWKHPKLGYVSPMTFIKIAEKTGLIISMGEQVLINACLFVKKLHNQGYEDVTVSVNVSAVQFQDSNFYNDVIRVLDLIGLEPRYLELEITESVLVQDFESIIGELRRLKEHGIRIAIDDFGQGYSSLAYLKNLPVDTLKIDKIFSDDILDLDDGENNHLLIDSIIILCKNMGLTALAEGVEKKEQMEYLKNSGCNKIQGYYVSKPVPEKEAMLLMKENLFKGV